MIDIVVPDGDEKKFIKIAEKLGFEGLVFLYNKPKNIKRLQSTTRLRLYTASAKGKADIAVAEGRDNARHLLEKTGVDVVYGLEREDGKDHTHYRYSGMNHVLAKIAHDRGKIVCFNIGKIASNTGMKRTRLMGRMMQNIKLCRKYDVKVCAASFAHSPYQMRAAGDIEALLKVMGMDAGKAKMSLSSISAILKGQSL